MQMKQMMWVFPWAFMAGAAGAQTPAPATSPAASITTGAVREAGTPPAALAPKVKMQEQPMSIEAQVVLQKIPADAKPAAPPATLKNQYPDKPTFVAALSEAGPGVAVELDGALVRGGFGPSLRYKTAPDGTVLR